MATLPALSEPTKRILDIKRANALEKFVLTEEHLAKYAVRRETALGASPKGQINSWEKAHAEVAPKLIGLQSSILFALDRLKELDREYWVFWYPSRLGYEVYGDWLNVITDQILAELAVLWKGRSESTDVWFEETCKPQLRVNLGETVRARLAQARSVEMERLQREPVPNFNGNPLLAEIATGNPGPAAQEALRQFRNSGVLKFETLEVNGPKRASNAPSPPDEARGTGSWNPGPEHLITSPVPDYPKQFSAEARARMAATCAQETLVFRQSPDKFNALFDYALKVTLAFAEECRRLVNSNSMSVEEMQRQVTDFRDGVFFHASIDSGHNRSTHSGMWQHIDPSAKARLDNSEPWERIQRTIIEVAESVAGAPQPRKATPTQFSGAEALKGDEAPAERAKSDAATSRPFENCETAEAVGSWEEEQVRAKSRQAVVVPILSKKGWKRGTLATKAGVGKNSIYEYLNGTRRIITEDNRIAIAEALGITESELPE